MGPVIVERTIRSVMRTINRSCATTCQIALAPNFHALRFDVAGVVKSDQHARQARPLIAVQRHSIGVDGQLGEIGEPAGAGVRGFAFIEHFRQERRRCGPIRSLAASSLPFGS